MGESIWTYQHRVRFVFGAGAIETLKEEVAALNAENPMVVCGTTAMRETGILARVESILGKKAFVYDKIPANPHHEIVDEGAEICRREGCDAVIGLGGGSAIDAAKAISMMSSHEGSIREYLEFTRTFERPGLPIIAVPTTSGTGTEANPFFVIVVKDIEAKLSGAPVWAYPTVSILDPELVVHLSERQTASTGLDVIAHAMEALWAKPASPVSDLAALEAIRLTLEWLPKAVADGKSLLAREKMMYACLQSALALCNTKTAVAHGVSYPMTVRWGLEHGFACAVTLPDFLDFTWNAIGEERTSALCRAMGVSDRGQCIDRLRQFCAEMGAPTSLSDSGVKPEDIDHFLDIINYKNVGNTIVDVSREQIAEILKKKL